MFEFCILAKFPGQPSNFTIFYIASKKRPFLYEFQIICGDSARIFLKIPAQMRKQLDNNEMQIENRRAAEASFTTERAITITDNSIDTRDIFIGTREVTITHGGERYRLRLTAQNKLILTK